MARQQTQRDLMDEAHTQMAIVSADAEMAVWKRTLDAAYALPQSQFCCVDCEFGNAPYYAQLRLDRLEHVLHDLGV
jgi:hypothetical protein